VGVLVAVESESDVVAGGPSGNGSGVAAGGHQGGRGARGRGIAGDLVGASQVVVDDQYAGVGPGVGESAGGAAQLAVADAAGRQRAGLLEVEPLEGGSFVDRRFGEAVEQDEFDPGVAFDPRVGAEQVREGSMLRGAYDIVVAGDDHPGEARFFEEAADSEHADPVAGLFDEVARQDDDIDSGVGERLQPFLENRGDLAVVEWFAVVRVAQVAQSGGVVGVGEGRGKRVDAIDDFEVTRVSVFESVGADQFHKGDRWLLAKRETGRMREAETAPHHTYAGDGVAPIRGSTELFYPILNTPYYA
jgi:hypothetical protein